MTIKQIMVILGSLMIFGGSIGKLPQTCLAFIYLIANIIIFIFMK